MNRKSPSGPEPVVLRALRAGDIPALIQLAQRTWRTHYASIISAEQIEYMLGVQFAEGELLNQIQAQTPAYTVAERSGELIGFITRRQKPPGWFIDKFYVATEAQGLGVGTALLRHISADLAPGSELRLHVNRGNRRAIDFYRRRGFDIEASIDLPYGPFTLNDYVMRKRL